MTQNELRGMIDQLDGLIYYTGDGRGPFLETEVMGNENIASVIADVERKLTDFYREVIGSGK